MAEINMGEPLSRGEFKYFINKIYSEDRAIIKNLSTYVEELGKDVGDYLVTVNNKLDAALKPGGAEAELSFYQDASNLFKDVNIFYDPRTGAPNKSGIQTPQDNVDFVNGQVDILSFISDFFGIGAILGGTLSGISDGKVKYGGIKMDGDLGAILTDLEYGINTNQYGINTNLYDRVEDQIDIVNKFKTTYRSAKSDAKELTGDANISENGSECKFSVYSEGQEK